MPVDGASATVDVREGGRPLPSRTAAWGLALWLLIAAPGGATAQTQRWDPPCDVAPTCAQLELVGRAALGGVGLAQAGPGSLVGSASTLGRRFGRTPRVALSIRGGATRFPWPDLAAAPVASRTATVGSLHGSVVVGLFDGFSPQPTVGGVLGLDLLATGDWVFLPDGDGFEGSGAAWGYGVRLGVIRESFSLPGITLSATRRHGGDIEVSPLSIDSGVELRGPVTTSLRGEIGKEFWGVGFLVGAGWDRYEADAAVAFPTSPGSLTVDRPIWNDFDAERALFFGGLSRTFVVWQLSAEFGWAEGVGGGLPEFPAYDAGEGTLFGTLALRLTL